MLYVLDLDDTLFLEKDFVRSGFKAVDQYLNAHTPVRHFYETAWELFVDGARGNIFNLVIEQGGYCVESELIDTLVSIYRSHQPKISLLPDALAFLNQTEKDHLALITDGYSHTQWNKISALNLKQYIGTIVVTGDWGHEFWKPHPRSFTEVARGHATNNCVYIGDNPKKDFISPEQLGWRSSYRVRREGSLSL